MKLYFFMNQKQMYFQCNLSVLYIPYDSTFMVEVCTLGFRFGGYVKPKALQAHSAQNLRKKQLVTKTYSDSTHPFKSSSEFVRILFTLQVLDSKPE